MILADISTLHSKQNHFTPLSRIFFKDKKNSNLLDLRLEFKDEMSSMRNLSRQQVEGKEHNGKGKSKALLELRVQFRLCHSQTAWLCASYFTPLGLGLLISKSPEAMVHREPLLSRNSPTPNHPTACWFYAASIFPQCHSSPPS